MLDTNQDELKSIASCKAVSLVAGEPTQDTNPAKIENEIEIKSYQQDWKNLPHHLSYRQDENSLQQLVSHIKWIIIKPRLNQRPSVLNCTLGFLLFRSAFTFISFRLKPVFGDVINQFWELLDLIFCIVQLYIITVIFLNIY